MHLFVRFEYPVWLVWKFKSSFNLIWLLWPVCRFKNSFNIIWLLQLKPSKEKLFKSQFSIGNISNKVMAHDCNILDRHTTTTSLFGQGLLCVILLGPSTQAVAHPFCFYPFFLIYIYIYIYIFISFSIPPISPPTNTPRIHHQTFKWDTLNSKFSCI